MADAPAPARWQMTEGGRRRTARVYTNETCNQNCAFCNRRSARERPDFVRASALAERLETAVRDASTVVLTGGEPALRSDLARFIERAKQRGAARVELETNGALIDSTRAGELVAAGLDLARIHLPAWGAACDEITRDPGGFEAALRGARALRESGAAIEIATPVVRANVETVARMPAHLAESDLGAAALVLGVPVDAPDRSALVSLERAARAIEATEAAARRAGVELRLDPHARVPPCLFEEPARVAHLFALTRGGRAREGYAPVEACTRCQVADRCPGLPDGEREALAHRVRPIETDRVRRRLSIISTVDEQIARELAQDEVARRPGEPFRHTRTVRINFRCNQTCSFCFVSTHLPSAPDDAIRASIVEAARQGAHLAISGGEPTLNPRLLEYVRLARAEGASFLELQTNAVLLGEGALARELCEAGVDLAYVSLHASSAEISDAITGAPGTFAKTVRGIDALRAAGVAVRLSYVFCRANAEDFPAYVELVAARWPGVEIGVSFVAASTDVVPRTPELVPRYAEILPSLARGMRLAADRGVGISGLESLCGIPLCLVPEDLTSFFELAEPPEGYAGDETVRGEACASCDLRRRCFGVRRGYAELHGTSELRPVHRARGA